MSRDEPSTQALPETIDAETLRHWMERGEPVTVLDVRPANERAEWSIPGSLHVDAYDALWAQDPHALDSAVLPAAKTVVTVCAVGKTSRLASSLLRTRGVRAASLEGGMKAWSGAWNVAEVTAPGAEVRVIQVRRTGKGCISYLVAAGGEAAVIDPSVHAEVYAGICRGNGWKITTVIETHVHADHVSRSLELLATAEAGLFIPAQRRVSFPFVPIRDGDLIDLGGRRGLLRAVHTPGHTDESTCYLLDDTLFSGDTLFLTGVGRPDLEGGLEEAAPRARALQQSLRKLCTLSGNTRVLPGHTSSPVAFDRVPISASLEQVRAANPILAMDESSFTKRILEKIPATPPNFRRIIQCNESGVPPQGDLLELEAGSNRCSVG